MQNPDESTKDKPVSPPPLPPDFPDIPQNPSSPLQPPPRPGSRPDKMAGTAEDETENDE
jgi:hypothetical protein